ncbi:CCA tRNA nucleotidyltransferase [Aquibacillus salsiterrae]|uniref:CCA-adding enzyme n=1 Tax=Aquibacillus salsiterrae TaxID=2950439 RepID=A0A9X3WAB6_9BACI|nr:CCA tRNA nucleotidyltransferase [Aquibacillus salsiterrae]MDC3415355.1 CCA tRNA nucleotidyltransferase [Aquibacillus salsiterrae]
MTNSLFNRANKLLSILEQHGFKAYIVGGAVRDSLMGRPVGDIDIATSASPAEVQSIFEKVIPVGIEHGTVIVRFDGESFEVTTFRVDGDYTDFRHPDHVLFVADIKEDLARRDFTINAMAMDKDGLVIDPFMGHQDIQLKLLRTVGKPKLRFEEDPLRMMRAIRFVSQLGFEMEATTFQALVDDISWIEKIAIERVTTEIKKMFEGINLTNGIELLIRSKAINYIPVLKENHQLERLLINNPKPLHSFTEIIATLHLLDRSISVDHWVKHWKLSNEVKRNATTLVQSITYYMEKRLDQWLVYRLPENLVSSFIRVLTWMVTDIDKKAINDQVVCMRKQLPIANLKHLAITGNEIVALKASLEKGPWINTCIAEIEKQVVCGNLPNCKNALREWVEAWSPPEIN